MNKQQGFTLLEVLIAVLIFAIGLLGLASLQTFGQRSNHSAYLRSQAIIQAYDMADRMRANRDSADKYTKAAAGEPSCDIYAKKCASDEIAEYDVWEWEKMTKTLLPGASATVKENDSQNYVVTIQWDDTADEEDQSSEFKMEFQP